MFIKRLLTLLLLTLSLYAKAFDFPNETLHYVVSYKWGVIHKEAGNVTLTLRDKGSDYIITLTAKSRPWADKIYSVRDTLISRVSKNGFKPQHYTRIAHEDGKFSRDEIAYSYSGNTVTAKARRERQRKDRRSASEKTLTADNIAWDMVSVFYYLRTIDFSKLSAGKSIVTTLFSAKEAETVTIKLLGEETIKLYNKEKVNALKISFKFTTAGKKKSSEDMYAWLSTDSSHVPLLVVGSLPVGQIKCYLTN